MSEAPVSPLASTAAAERLAAAEAALGLGGGRRSLCGMDAGRPGRAAADHAARPCADRPSDRCADDGRRNGGGAVVKTSVSSCPDCDSARHARDTGPRGVSTPGANVVSTPRLSRRARWLVWRGQKLIALGLLIPVHVRRGGWRQRLANWLLRGGADCFMRAYRMGAR